MRYEQLEACIDACYACALANDRCAAGCLHEANLHAMEECIVLNADCAEICRLAAAYMERDSVVTAAICEACVAVCERTQEMCDIYQMDYCKACAEACRNCAQECRALIRTAHLEIHHSRDSVLAGLRQ